MGWRAERLTKIQLPLRRSANPLKLSVRHSTREDTAGSWWTTGHTHRYPGGTGASVIISVLSYGLDEHSHLSFVFLVATALSSQHNSTARYQHLRESNRNVNNDIVGRCGQGSGQESPCDPGIKRDKLYEWSNT